MTLTQFDKGLQNNNAVDISKKYKIWNDYELWIDRGDYYENHKYNSLEELCEANPEVKEIIDNNEDFNIIEFVEE